MRILIPIHSFEPGGVERVALRLAAAWQDRGHEVTVLLGRDAGACRAEAPSLRYVGYPEPVPTARWETPWLIACLLRYLWRERPEVMFCAGNTYTVVCVAARLLLAWRCPPVLVKISNDLDPRYLPAPARPFYRAWLWCQGRLLDRFVALAEPMRGPIARHLRVSADRVGVIADPALAEAEYAQLSAIPRPAARRQHIVAVGRMVGQKNHLLLIAAFARHAPADARLTIAGDGPLRPRIEHAARQLGVADRIALPGHVADIPAFLAHADLMVISSDYEGVPAAVIEALAAGLPVAATECCDSMAWLLGSGQFGTLARCGSANSLGTAIAATLAMKFDPAAARRYVRPFMIEQAALPYLAAMRGLVQGTAAPADQPVARPETRDAR